MSDATSRGIRIQVESCFVPEHSQPQAGQWIFLTTVCITNEGESTVQLISRHWMTTDAQGKVEEVKGPGNETFDAVIVPFILSEPHSIN